MRATLLQNTSDSHSKLNFTIFSRKQTFVNAAGVWLVFTKTVCYFREFNTAGMIRMIMLEYSMLVETN